MKNLPQLIFAILFATSIGSINAPMFNERKHETFAKTTHDWVLVFRGVKSNGLQKFIVLTHEFWALNIEKAIQKLSKRLGDDLIDTMKVESSYYVFINIEP